jgi:hypothetical protein
MNRGTMSMYAYSISSVTSRTTKQAGTTMAMIMVLPLEFRAISEGSAILIQVMCTGVAEWVVRSGSGI